MFSRILYVLFFLSGFCGLIYQVVWMRLAFASFGVVTPVMSVVVSTFMFGLSLGSFLAGRWVHKLPAFFSPIRAYALAEIGIGLSAFLVPMLFKWGGNALLSEGSMDSGSYLFWSALILACSLFPFCVCMGFTFPLMMAFIRQKTSAHESSFSFLYQANVLGAMAGCVGTAVLFIELLGFRHALMMAGGLNFSIAGLSLFLERFPVGVLFSKTRSVPEEVNSPLVSSSKQTGGLLFLTGFVSMALEVIWTREFTPVLGNTIYAFSGLLTVYLFATWVGTGWYRAHLSKGKRFSLEVLIGGVMAGGLLPILMNDPNILPWGSFPLVIGIFPFCLALGYLTPLLIDQNGAGDPGVAGRAYALNVLGCILGPLFAAYVLLPHWGTRISSVFLLIPFFWFWRVFLPGVFFKKFIRLCCLTGLLALFAVTVFVCRSLEEGHTGFQKEIRRDHTATVICHGEGLDKSLLVNGIGMTRLTTITKDMAHLPLLFLDKKPRSVLVICFGMGTTYRAFMSWNIPRVYAVELVPGVRDSFPYFHEDARALMKNPKGKIVVDDGRRFLKRMKESFDVIVLDPPPPIEAAGSSLLCSREFLELCREHLKPGGILMHWFPYGEKRFCWRWPKRSTKFFPT